MTGAFARAEIDVAGKRARAWAGGGADGATTGRAPSPGARFLWVLQSTIQPFPANNPVFDIFDGWSLTPVAIVQAAHGGAGPCAISSATVPTRTPMLDEPESSPTPPLRCSAVDIACSVIHSGHDSYNRVRHFY